MKAAYVQYEPVYLQVEENLDQVERLIEGIDADLIVLPELFATGYYFKSPDDLKQVAEPLDDGKTARRLVQWAEKTGATFVAGFAETDEEAIFNSAIIVSGEGIAGSYRKVHLFSEEKLLFAPGNLGFPVFHVSDREGTAYQLGVMICFDWYYPESARSLALAGADLIAHPSNLVRKDCPRATPIRALENHVYTITANRTGREEKYGSYLEFIGQSLICGPEGDVLMQSGRDEVMVGIADFDVTRARDRRITDHNDLLADRRPEAYAL